LRGIDENIIEPSSRPMNAAPERKETPHGISRWTELALRKAKASIRANLELTAKWTDVRDLQEKKAFSQMTSTEDGIAIEINPLSEKVER
jgi:hypothetical protein